MSKLWKKLGNLLYLLMLPLIALAVNNSHRSRVLIFVNSKLLVTKDWLGDGKWELPGGGLKPGETELESAIREVKEEVGIQLRASDLKFIHSLGFKDGLIKIKISIFEVRLKDARPIKKQKMEITEAEWIDPKELSEANAGADVLIALASLGAK